MKIDNNLIKEVQNVPILRIAEKLDIEVHTKKAMCFKGHDNKTPSLSFTPEKNLWHCFGCGLGGNNITLVKEYFGYSFTDTVNWIAHEFGLSSNWNVKKKRVAIFKRNIVRTEGKISKGDPEIYESFISKCNLSDRGKRYLINRGFTEETINHFKVKDVVDIKKTENWLINNYDIDRLIKSGLMTKRCGNLCLIWWDHTILFPFFKENKIIYIQGRRLVSDTPKYMGLCGVSKPLYNQDVLINLPKGSMRWSGLSVPVCLTC